MVEPETGITIGDGGAPANTMKDEYDNWDYVFTFKLDTQGEAACDTMITRLHDVSLQTNRMVCWWCG